MTRIAFTWVCTILIAASAAALENGDFETVDKGKLAGWEVQEDNAAVTPERIRGKWYHFICDVKPGRFDKIHLYLSFQQHGVGSVWWDNFTSDNLKIVNPDFEQVDANGSLVGWRQDNAGKTIFSDTRKVAHGTRSLRMTRKGGIAPTRVWQIIEVEKDADYRFEFDCYLSDQFKGQPNVATLTYENDGKYYGSPMWIRTPSWTEILTERAGESDRIALFGLRGGSAELSQAVSLQAPGNAELAVSVKTKGLDGALRLVVEDSAGKTLGQVEETAEDSKWHELKLPFKNETDDLRVRLIGEGRGQVRVDSATLGPPALVPPAQQIGWESADKNLVLGDEVAIRVAGASGGPLAGALEILRKDLAAVGVALEETDAPDAQIRVNVAPAGAVEGKGLESYTLAVDPSGVEISAGSDAGALCAVTTLVQLLRSYARSGRAEIVACRITDWPDMPLRGAFWSPDFNWEQFARHKLNLMYLSTSYWLEWHAFPEEVPRVHQYFQDAEKFGVAILASTGVFQGHEVYQYHDPNLAEGKSVDGEKIVLTKETPVALRHALVLRTKLRGLTLTSADGSTVYKEGTDYAVTLGTPVSYPFQKIKDPEPDMIRRLPGGAIPDGAAVLASYNYGEPAGKMEICLSEPDATRIPAEALAASFREFPRLRLFNVNLDEIAYFRMCSLCKASDKSNDQLMCDWITAMDQAVKAAQPDARLVTWDDMLCPHVDARNIGIQDPASLLPKDMLLMSWGYNADFPQHHGWPAVRYWSSHHLETIVVPWDNKINIRAWAQVVAEARRRGWPCSGMLASYWHNRHAFRESAICSWRIPRKDEPRWIKLDFAR